jgi:WD40 repeat protein
VLSGGDRGFVRLWDATTGAELAQLRGQADRPRALAWTPDSRRVAVTAGSEAHVYAVPAGTLLATVAHSQPIDALAFDPTGTRLLTGARDLTARLWALHDTGDGAVRATELRTFVGHGGDIAHIGFDAGGRLAVTAGADGVLRVFDTGDGGTSRGVELMRYEVGGAVEEALFDGESRRLLAFATSQRAVVWEFADTRGTATLRQPGPVPAAAFDATGNRIVTAGDDERLRLWSAHDGQPLWSTEPLGKPVQTLDVDEAGERIVLGTIDGRVAVHRLADGARLFELPAHRDRVPVARFAARGTRILTAGADGQVVVWNANDQSQLLRLERPAPVVAADLSPDGRTLLTVDRLTNHVAVWEVPSGAALGTLAEHTGDVLWVAFRPDGAAILTASADGTARITGRDGRLLATLASGQPVEHATWSRDGSRVLTIAAKDHQARLWNVADGSEQLRVRGHTGAIAFGAFSPDGQWAATCANDGTTRIWPLDPVAVARRLHPTAPPELAPPPARK